MAIIAISRRAFSKGAVVAQKVAERLGYRSISNEVIIHASQKYHIPEAKLYRAIHDAPSLLERFTSQQQKLVAFVAAEIIANYKDDNIVYHGLAGHFFASNVSPIAAKILAFYNNENVISHGLLGCSIANSISHLINVRIVVNFDERVALAIDTLNMDKDKARAYLQKDDNHRNAWSRRFYGIDDADFSLYDLVVQVNKLTVDDAVDIICNTVLKREQFKTSKESQQAIENLALATEVKVALLKDYPHCEVVAKGSSVEIFTRFTVHSDTAMAEKIKDLAMAITGVSEVSVVLVPSVVFS